MHLERVIIASVWKEPPDSPSPAKSVSANMLDNDLGPKSSLMIIPSSWNKSLLSDQTRLLLLASLISSADGGSSLVKKSKGAARKMSEFELNA